MNEEAMGNTDGGADGAQRCANSQDPNLGYIKHTGYTKFRVFIQFQGNI